MLIKMCLANKNKFKKLILFLLMVKTRRSVNKNLLQNTTPSKSTGGKGLKNNFKYFLILIINKIILFLNCN